MTIRRATRITDTNTDTRPTRRSVMARLRRDNGETLTLGDACEMLVDTGMTASAAYDWIVANTRI